MSTLINASIDVTKIDKAKLYNGKYLNVTISINDQTDAYGNNVSVTESQSKEERDLKTSKRYIGNGKVVYTNGDVKVAEKQEKPLQTASQKFAQQESDDLPFNAEL
jgi:hypothetical protein